MKTKHTSGPWYYTCGAIWKDPEAETYCIAKADRNTPETAPTERDANCRLIAAAPELLEALWQLVNAYDTWIADNHPGLKAGGYDGMVGLARAAIAKATGE